MNPFLRLLRYATPHKTVMAGAAVAILIVSWGPGLWRRERSDLPENAMRGPLLAFHPLGKPQWAPRYGPAEARQFIDYSRLRCEAPVARMGR